MNDFKLKSNEMMFFLDFNKTLVDYTNEYDYSKLYIDSMDYENPYSIRDIITKALVEFEKETGITPVVCVVTNARYNVIDNNGYEGICNDLYETFFHEDRKMKSSSKMDCRRFFKYLMHYENDFFIRLNPTALNYRDVFEIIPFNQTALDIRYIDKFKKKESVDRMMSVIDPKKQASKFILFAGDSIVDDYPMKEIWTPEGVSKIFIRPSRSKKLTYSVMREFCEAKGDTFSSVNPKNGKKIICSDPVSFALLSPEDQAKILNYDSGDYVYLTTKDTRGLADGISMAADLIKGQTANEKQMS